SWLHPTPRTHAKRKHAASRPNCIHTVNECIRGGRQYRSPVARTVVLNTINKLLGMFNPYAQRKRLGLDGQSLLVQKVKDVTRRMTRGQDHPLTFKFVTVMRRSEERRVGT